MNTLPCIQTSNEATPRRTRVATVTLRFAFLALVLTTTGCSLLFGGGQGSAKGSNDATRGTGDGDGSGDGKAAIVSGDGPTIPAGFEGIELGMTRDEVRAINEKAACEKGKLCGGTGQNAYPGVSWFVTFSDETDRVQYLRLTIDDEGQRSEFAQKLEGAWGKPTVGKDVVDHRLEAWFDDETGIRAIYDSEDGELKFRRYIAFSELFGDDEPLPAPVLGKTAEEAAEALGVDLVGESEVRLLPTRYAELWTSVHLSIERGKVDGYWYTLGERSFEEASRPAVREIVAAKYGEPERLAEKSYGCKEETLLLRKAKPRMVLNWDKISERWEMHVSQSNFDPCML